MRDARTLIVFDLETIPDTGVANQLTGLDHLKTETEKREAMLNYHLEITDGKNPFLRQPFWKVITISFAILRLEKKHIEFKGILSNSIGIGDKCITEKDLITKFFEYIKKCLERDGEKPILVSYNGKMFDIPVLQYRAMKYGIQAPEFYMRKSKWDGYEYRYSDDNIDLIDALSNYSTSAKVKMLEVCSVFNIPCKFSNSGADVTEMYDAGKIVEIQNYCEIDVICTVLIYLKYIMHRGVIEQYSFEGFISYFIQELAHIYSDKNVDIKEFLSLFNIDKYLYGCAN